MITATAGESNFKIHGYPFSIRPRFGHGEQYERNGRAPVSNTREDIEFPSKWKNEK
jgi:hypothetical protein